MTTDEINIALAKWEGWRAIKKYLYWADDEGIVRVKELGGAPPGEALKCHTQIPSYTTDLNAVWQLEEKLEQEHTIKCAEYAINLRYSIDTQLVGDFRLIHSTALQRCEALLRTLGLWTDNP